MPNTPSIKCENVYRALRRQGHDKESAARISNAMYNRGKCGGKRKEMSMEAETEKHGRHNQRTHANRYSGQSFGKVKEHFKGLSKGERERYKAKARELRGGGGGGGGASKPRPSFPDDAKIKDISRSREPGVMTFGKGDRYVGVWLNSRGHGLAASPGNMFALNEKGQTQVLKMTQSNIKDFMGRLQGAGYQPIVIEVGG